MAPETLLIVVATLWSRWSSRNQNACVVWSAPKAPARLGRPASMWPRPSNCLEDVDNMLTLSPVFQVCISFPIHFNDFFFTCSLLNHQISVSDQFIIPMSWSPKTCLYDCFSGPPNSKDSVPNSGSIFWSPSLIMKVVAAFSMSIHILWGSKNILTWSTQIRVWSYFSDWASFPHSCISHFWIQKKMYLCLFWY